jgi:hypothetical protein
MNKRIALAVVGTIIALGVGISVIQDTKDSEKYSEAFHLDATFYQDKKSVQIKFDDSTGKTTTSVLEILGMEESYQKTITGSHFEIQVQFDGVPKYGWKSMPITLLVEHQEFGKIGIKTEIHNQDEPPSKTIFSKL